MGYRGCLLRVLGQQQCDGAANLTAGCSYAQVHLVGKWLEA